MKIRDLVRAWLGISLTALAVGAAAETLPIRAAVVALDIKSQPITAALNEFGQQTGIQVLFYSNVADGVKEVPALTGTFTPDDALTRLLSKTGLMYSYVNERTVAIHRAVGFVSKHRPNAETDATPISAPIVRLANDIKVTEDLPQQSFRSINGASTERGDRMEEVIVTAQKKEERLIDTPLSVSVMSSSDLTKLGATQFRDFANTVPGLSFQTGGPGYTQISLRGVSVGQDIAPTVAVYVDEVPYGASTTFARGGQITLDAGLFDVDRIEVLRGPQGTLYGASTVGGLIKYVTKRPDADTFGGDARVGISQTLHGGANYDVAAAANLPIVSDKAAVRISGFESHDDGYIDNLASGKKDVNESDMYGGRFDLLVTPLDKLSIRLNGFLQNTSTEGFPLSDFTRAGVPVNGSLAQRRLLDESFDQRYRLGSATVNYEFGKASLTSISSYQTVSSTLVVDGTPLYRPTLPAGIVTSAVGYSDASSTDKFTQELRLASLGPQRLEWLIGGFYTHEESTLDAAYILVGVDGQVLPNTVYTFSGPSTYEESAIFGDLTWNVTDKLSVSGGLRYAENRQSFEQMGTGTFGLSSPLAKSTEDVTTYLANASYRFSDHAVGYLRYATGYRPGGPNLRVVDPTTGALLGTPEFEADRLKSYEAGFKSDTEDGRFGLELAGYYIDWSNIQLNVVRLGFGTKANAPGGATVRGGELTLTAHPISGLTVRGSYAYQDARMSDALPAVFAAKDERLPAVPQHAASLSPDYEFSGSPWRSSIGATVRYVGGSKTIFGPNGYALPEYTMVDLRAGITVNAVDVQFYVRNLADERAQLTPRFRYFPANSPHVSILQPRTIGVSVTTKF